MTCPGVAPEAVNVWAILVPLPALPPVAPVCATVQAMLPPLIEEDKLMLAEVPLQIDKEVGVAVRTGLGFTVRFKVVVLSQPVTSEGVVKLATAEPPLFTTIPFQV